MNRGDTDVSDNIKQHKIKEIEKMLQELYDGENDDVCRNRMKRIKKDISSVFDNESTDDTHCPEPDYGVGSTIRNNVIGQAEAALEHFN